MRIPLSNKFTAFSLIGFMISLFLTLFQRIPLSWGILMIFMFMMFIVSSLISVMPDKDESF